MVLFKPDLSEAAVLQSRDRPSRSGVQAGRDPASQRHPVHGQHPARRPVKTKLLSHLPSARGVRCGSLRPTLVQERGDHLPAPVRELPARGARLITLSWLVVLLGFRGLC
jgi:hypothetical protein